jgi:uncharacterized protein (DUF4415 family)
MRKERIVSYSPDEIREKLARERSGTDWSRVNAMSDDEIEVKMRADPDWADAIDIDWSNADIVYPIAKNAISIRLDQDIIDFFKSTGKGYQTRMNTVLRHYMTQTQRKKNNKAG